MHKIFIAFISLLISATAFAQTVDTVKVPFQRVRFHDRINNEQKMCDRADGKLDGIIKVSGNEEVNLQVTDVLVRKIDALENYIETNDRITTNNEKIRYLNYVEQVVRSFREEWKRKKLNPALAPVLIDNFEKILVNNIDSVSMAPFIAEVPYEVGVINAGIFSKNKGFNDSKKILFFKYCTTHPEDILTTIKPYAEEPFADSLLGIAAAKNPVQLYSYAQAINSPEGKLIHRSANPTVKAVAELSQTPNALLYFPFLDDILKGKQSIDSIKKYVGDGEKTYDSVGYYKLLVRTEIDYSWRLLSKDTPIAMFGANGLRDVLQRKAIEHFVNPINNLHEENNLNIRMRALDPLSAQDIYFMMVMGENDIYTSSYKHSFARMLQRMGPKPQTDALLKSVKMDYFKKFIKMAANFNQLDTFLKLMPPENSEVLMKAFVSNLDRGTSLEDAVDVADSYSSIKDRALLDAILQNVKDNEQKNIESNNNKGKIIYSLLRTIFTSADNPGQIDLTAEIGIPSIYTIDNKYLQDDSGRIVQQVFFYGDDDGKAIFPAFVNSFPKSDWKITMQKEWVEIKSIKGKRVWIYANRPLDNDKNLDDTAQVHLGKYLDKMGLYPSVVIHRGHSYWLPRTVDRMPVDAKIVVLGSCGGYKNLNQILDICPDAHIISTKEIGKGDINRPILDYMNKEFLNGRLLVWKDMWSSLTKTFSTDPNKEVRESWEDYIPPYKNLGAIFIKAYNKKMEGE